jgi:hypothetical protein
MLLPPPVSSSSAATTVEAAAVVLMTVALDRKIKPASSKKNYDDDCQISIPN